MFLNEDDAVDDNVVASASGPGTLQTVFTLVVSLAVSS